MTAVSRGLVQHMSEVALAMWNMAARAYAEHASQGVELDEADEELDVLHEQLTNEVASGGMTAPLGRSGHTALPFLRTPRRSRGQPGPPDRHLTEVSRGAPRPEPEASFGNPVPGPGPYRPPCTRVHGGGQMATRSRSQFIDDGPWWNTPRPIPADPTRSRSRCRR